MHPRFKLLALAPILVVGALIGSACSTVTPSAATVNGESIDRSTFNDALHAYAGNAAFIALVSQGGQGAVTGNGSDTVSADFARQALQREIVVRVAEQENKARGGQVTPEIEAAARDDVQAQFGLEAFEAFPASFQKALVDQNAQIFALRAKIAGSTLDDAALQKVFDADPSQFAEVSASHILLNTKEEADAVEARLKAGEDFAAVASETSIDTSSATQGGDLGCIARGVTVPEFESTLFAQKLGTVSDPVKTEFGYHVIKVTDRKSPAFADAKPLVLKKVLDDSDTDFNKVLNDSLAKARITVDPRFGVWNPSLSQVVAASVADVKSSTATTAATGGAAPTTGG